VVLTNLKFGLNDLSEKQLCVMRTITYHIMWNKGFAKQIKWFRHHNC